MWVRRKELFLFYIWRSWAVLHCWITLLLHKTYLVSIVWLKGILISNICDDPIIIQQLLLTLFFTNYKQNKTKQNKTKQNKTKQNKTKQNKTKQNNPFLVETAMCEFTIAALYHYSCFASMTLLYLILCISLNVLLSLARLESNC